MNEINIIICSPHQRIGMLIRAFAGMEDLQCDNKNPVSLGII